MFDIRFAPQAIIDLDEIKHYVADHLSNVAIQPIQEDVARRATTTGMPKIFRQTKFRKEQFIVLLRPVSD
ncbi:MAG: hypothetical protein WC340_08910 [Kiritimatiellia bacterium]|jgi:hypothetical protein